jgi:hypothetical protein
MKLLRTIRLDPSDTFVFDQAAEPGEWAVSGGFVFYATDPQALTGKARSAFRSGFLGIESFGWSTLVQVVSATEADRTTLVDVLADQLMKRCGAPDRNVALAAAKEEVAFAASIAEHPEETLVALHRHVDEGTVREQFRTLRRRAGERPLRAFSFLDAEDEEGTPEDAVDLAALAQTGVGR